MGPSVSDERIQTAIDRWLWRLSSDDNPQRAVATILAMVVEWNGRAKAREVFLAVADGPHPPVGWWDG